MGLINLNINYQPPLTKEEATAQEAQSILQLMREHDATMVFVSESLDVLVDPAATFPLRAGTIYVDRGRYFREFVSKSAFDQLQADGLIEKKGEDSWATFYKLSESAKRSLPLPGHLRQLAKHLVGVEKVTDLVLAKATTARL